VPPFRLQSVIVRALKLLPEATCTSKYSPGAEKLGLPTGSLPYWDTVTAPSSLAVTVVPSLVTLQVPDELDEEQFCELVAPEGGEGGEDDEGGEPPDGGGVTTAELTVRAKLHVPVSPLVSLSPPPTV
jgi:hypothetical protein